MAEPAPDAPKPLNPKAFTRNPTRGYVPSSAAWLGAAGAVLDGKPFFTWLRIPEMVRDPQVRFAERMWCAPFRRVTFAVKAESKAVAAFVNSSLHRFWARSLPLLLPKYFRYGYAPGGAEFCRRRGMVQLDRVRAVQPPDARPLVWAGGAAKGQPAGFTLPGAGRVLPPHAFWYAGTQELGPAYDMPPLAGMFVPWVEKNSRNGASDQRRLAWRRAAGSGGEVRYPDGTSTFGPDENPQTWNNEDLARELLDFYEAFGGLVMKNDAHPGIPGEFAWKFTPPKATTEGLAGIGEYIKDLDNDMLRGAGIPPEVLEASEVGSGWSGRMIPLMGFFGEIDKHAGLIVEAADNGWLKHAVAVNFGRAAWYEVEPVPLTDQLQQSAQGGPGGQEGPNPVPGMMGRGGGSGPGSGGPKSHGDLVPKTGNREHPGRWVRSENLSDGRGSPVPREVRRRVRRLVEKRARELSDDRAAPGPRADALPAVYLAMLRAQERAHLRGDPARAKPYLDELVKLLRDPERLATAAGVESLSWEPYEGPRHGRGWQDTDTGRVVYGAGNAPGSRREKRQAAAQRAREITSAVMHGEATPEHLEELAGHLPHLSVQQLRNARIKMAARFAGAKRRDAMVRALEEHVRGRVAAGRAEPAAPPVVEQPAAKKLPPADPAAFGKEVQSIADSHPHGFAPNKVWIGDVYDKMREKYPGLSREQFDASLSAAKAGRHVTLSRADLTNLMDPNRLAASEHGAKGTTGHSHFVLAKENPARQLVGHNLRAGAGQPAGNPAPRAAEPFDSLRQVRDSLTPDTPEHTALASAIRKHDRAGAVGDAAAEAVAAAPGLRERLAGHLPADPHAGTPFGALLAERGKATGKARDLLDTAVGGMTGWDAATGELHPEAKIDPAQLARRLVSAHVQGGRTGATAEDLAPLERLMGSAGVTMTHKPGDVVPFDGGRHDHPSGPVSEGQPVTVESPLYTREGGTHTLQRAVVRAAGGMPPPPTPPPPPVPPAAPEPGGSSQPKKVAGGQLESEWAPSNGPNGGSIRYHPRRLKDGGEVLAVGAEHQHGIVSGVHIGRSGKVTYTVRPRTPKEESAHAARQHAAAEADRAWAEVGSAAKQTHAWPGAALGPAPEWKPVGGGRFVGRLPDGRAVGKRVQSGHDDYHESYHVPADTDLTAAAPSPLAAHPPDAKLDPGMRGRITHAAFGAGYGAAYEADRKAAGEAMAELSRAVGAAKTVGEANAAHANFVAKVKEIATRK